MPQATRTTQADDDLFEILHAVGRHSAKAAPRLRAEIDAAAKLLLNCPKLGRTRDELAHDLRSHPVGRYLVYYYITDDGIEIARIIHGSRDITPEMFD